MYIYDVKCPVCVRDCGVEVSQLYFEHRMALAFFRCHNMVSAATLTVSGFPDRLQVIGSWLDAGARIATEQAVDERFAVKRICTTCGVVDAIDIADGLRAVCIIRGLLFAKGYCKGEKCSRLLVEYPLNPYEIGLLKARLGITD